MTWCHDCASNPRPRSSGGTPPQLRPRVSHSDLSRTSRDIHTTSRTSSVFSILVPISITLSIPYHYCTRPFRTHVQHVRTNPFLSVPFPYDPDLSVLFPYAFLAPTTYFFCIPYDTSTAAHGFNSAFSSLIMFLSGSRRCRRSHPAPSLHRSTRRPLEGLPTASSAHYRCPSLR